MDPFAGFGSIPFEALRLGLDATAVELLPSCYIFLKVILEYPKKYGERLVKDVERWGEWVTERLGEDPVIKKLYDPEVAVYIGSWEVRCPHCSKWTPLIGNFWLARVKGNKGGYRRLAWMEVTKDNSGDLLITVKDLNRQFDSLKGVEVQGRRVKADDKIFIVHEANLSPRSEQATCLSCGGKIRYIDTATLKHYVDPNEAPDKQRLVWYVKYAIGKYNKGEQSSARLRLLVKAKIKGSDLGFIPCDGQDQNRLDLATEEMQKFVQHCDPDIPLESIAPYDVRSIWVVNYGFEKWAHLFNPRQLLALVKLVKAIREAGGLIEAEKKSQGWSIENATRYSEAVTTYLAIALCKYADHNCLATSVEPTRKLIAHALAVRGIAMMWNWCEINPACDIIGSWNRCIKYATKSLKYILNSLSNFKNLALERWNDREIGKERIGVLLDDATVLTKLNPVSRFDLVFTDPPYYDDVPYAELSDFYYVWLKRVLSNVENGKLTPGFHKTIFFKKLGEQWIEVRTQWEGFALREASLNPPRLGKGVSLKEAVEYFQKLLDASFMTMAQLLKDDGVLATYYAHTSPEAWKALLRSGWESAGLSIISIFPVITDPIESVIKRGKLSLDTSMVVVWRGSASGSVQASRLYEDMVESSEERARILMDMSIGGRDLFVGTLARALSVATRYKEVVEMKKLETGEIVDRYVYPATLYGLVRA
ncbi:MAG: DUF1156 domain-containing protein, partial [Candidatus Bathycorpusculaceae bacterium]